MDSNRWVCTEIRISTDTTLWGRVRVSTLLSSSFSLFFCLCLPLSFSLSLLLTTLPFPPFNPPSPPPFPSSPLGLGPNQPNGPDPSQPLSSQGGGPGGPDGSGHGNYQQVPGNHLVPMPMYQQPPLQNGQGGAYQFSSPTINIVSFCHFYS